MREIAQRLGWTVAILLLEALQWCDRWSSKRQAKSLRAVLRVPSIRSL